MERKLLAVLAALVLGLSVATCASVGAVSSAAPPPLRLCSGRGSGQAQATAAPTPPAPDEQPAYVPGRLLVRFEVSVRKAPRRGAVVATDVDSVNVLLQKYRASDLEPLLADVPGASSLVPGVPGLAAPLGLGDLSTVYELTLPTDADVPAAAGDFAADPNVVYAEPDYVVRAVVNPDDGDFPRQWGLHNTGQSGATVNADVDAPQAWDLTTGRAEVTMAIVDSGIDAGHPDLAANVVTGHDFVDGDDQPRDGLGHGTHVAGIAAAIGNNGQGIAGIAWRARILPVRALDDSGGGSISNLARGIVYATDQGARVINMSVQFPGFSQTVWDAVQYAHDRRRLLVAAAGNYAQRGNPVLYPGAYEHVLAVAATDWHDQPAPYSEYGAYVDIAAPGGVMGVAHDPGGILSTMPTYHVTYSDDPFYQTRLNYDYLVGTSMASPFVSGAAALVWSVRPDLSGDEVESFLESYADRVGPYPYSGGRNDHYGYGRLNVFRAVQAALSSGQPTPTPTRTPTPRPPTPTPSATLRASPTPRPPTPTPFAGSRELIVNGGFEDDRAWTIPNTALRAGYSTRLAHSGRRSMRVGIDGQPDGYGYSSTWQTVTIPSQITSATLSFWYYPISQGTLPHDLQFVVVLGEDYRHLATVLFASSNARTWVHRTFDLTPFAGRTVIVYFGTRNDRRYGGPTALYVDDVSLIARAGGGPGPTVTPSATLRASPTPTPTSVPGGEEVLLNGGFEELGYWRIGLTPHPAGRSRLVVHSGGYAMRLGIESGSNRFSYSSIIQDVAIPAGATQARLTFWYYPTGQGDTTGNRQEARILDSQYRTLSTVLLTNANTRQWTSVAFDLTPYRGRQVKLYFNVFNDGWGSTSAMYVDDVSVRVVR